MMNIAEVLQNVANLADPPPPRGAAPHHARPSRSGTPHEAGPRARSPGELLRGPESAALDLPVVVVVRARVPGPVRGYG